MTFLNNELHYFKYLLKCHILNVIPLGINVNSKFIHLKANLLKFYIDKICDCSQYSSQYFCITCVCIHINNSDTIQNITCVINVCFLIFPNHLCEI